MDGERLGDVVHRHNANCRKNPSHHGKESIFCPVIDDKGVRTFILLYFPYTQLHIDTKYSQFHYFKSGKYAESPVNPVVQRRTLWKLADMKGGVVGNILTPINDW